MNTEPGAVLRKFLGTSVLLAGLLVCHHGVCSEAGFDVAKELKRADQLIKSDPKQARSVLWALESARFEPAQRLHFQLLKASVLGYFNQHRERVSYVNGFIDAVQDPDIKSKFLYQLSESYIAIGAFEPALDVMNTSIELLPRVTDTIAKIDTLQSAITLLISLHAYDEALTYADRMYDLPVPEQDLRAKCIAGGDRVEIYMLKNQRAAARAQMHEAVEMCDRTGWTFISLIVKTFSVIDLIDNQEYEHGIAAGLPVLSSFGSPAIGLDYVSRLEEALARAYLQTGRLPSAEKYGLLAYQHAESQKLVLQMEKSLETLSQIKRAEAQYESAFGYAQQALLQKNALLDEQLQKNIAYQRVKFSMTDQLNHVSLLEKQNKFLAMEQQLEKKNSQNLWLIIALAVFVTTALGLYLWTVIRQKNLLRSKSQIDGLTRISNRSHFMTCADQLVNVRADAVSLILFDMDLFKRVNDSFGHPAGDWVLSTTCQVVSGVLRPGDVFGRLGGEEFAICLPKTDVASAFKLAEACRAAIAAINTAPCGFQFSLSASFGIASLPANHTGHFANLLVAADKALYQAKANGRNCVAVQT